MRKIVRGGLIALAFAATSVAEEGVSDDTARLAQVAPLDGPPVRSAMDAALDKRGMELVTEDTYTRNSVVVKTALLDIRKAEPQAVVMVGAYRPVAEFIRLAGKLDFTPTFVNISFVGSDALAAELGPDGEGVIISQVVPFPWDATLPVVAEYQAAVKAVDAQANLGFVSLEGYITGRVAIEALETAGADLTRASFLAALDDLGTIVLGGAALAYGVGDNQGSDDVFLTRITAGGTFEQVDAAAPVLGG